MLIQGTGFSSVLEATIELRNGVLGVAVSFLTCDAGFKTL
jgi:hypothetical protein